MKRKNGLKFDFDDGKENKHKNLLRTKAQGDIIIHRTSLHCAAIGRKEKRTLLENVFNGNKLNKGQSLFQPSLPQRQVKVGAPLWKSTP